MSDLKDSPSEYWRQVEDLFHEALTQPPGARTEFLRQRCGGNDSLENEVAGIVKGYEEQENFPVPETTRQGRRYGSYEIVSKIGSGGMGDVYLARRWEDFEQRVALKVIGGDLLLQPWLAERFRQERQILASLDHPSIARLLNGGVTPAGEPYLVMEYVEGTRLDEYCQQSRLSVPGRLKLFQKICLAVQAAHECHVIHRDLKPGNILVNDRGEPKLLDFGIAKVLAPERNPTGAMAASPTTGGLLLTPGYSSPERLRGEPATVANDIYSLGVILYELLTGRRPDAAPPDASPAEIISAVITGSVRPPSETAPAEQKKLLRGGPDRILLKALAANPAERYASVLELWDEVQRHLDHKPVLAPARDRTFGTRKAWATAVGTGLAASLLAFAAWSAHASKDFSVTAKPQIDSLLVLPFEDRSSDRQSEYLADGLTDEVTNDLANVNGLRVIARTSAFQFKGKPVDLPRIGRQLKVQAVLQGNVVRQGGHIHIHAQLDRTQDGSHVWSNTYDTDFHDLAAVQLEMARSIADDLQFSRSKTAPSLLIAPGSAIDAEAHDLYLRGLAAANTGSTEGLRKAVPLMQAAIAKDAHYAAPWFALAKMTEAMGYFGGWTAGAADLVRSDLDHALELDPQMAAAHADLAYFDWEYGYDWDHAQREFQLALQQGNRAEVHKLYAMSLADRGEFAQSHEHLRIAEDLAPLDTELLFVEGGVLAWERRFPEAEQKYLAMLRVNPGAAAALAAMAYVKTFEKDCDGAASYQSRLAKLAATDYRTASAHYAVLVCRGDKAGALELLREGDPVKVRRIPALEMAEGFAYIGDKESALKYLELAVEHHDFGATSMKQTPYLDSLHGDSRFAALERRVGLTP